MKLGKRVTRWERTREVKVANIVRKVDHTQSKRQRCNACGRLLHLHLPVYLVGVALPVGGGSGAALCCDCGLDAEKEVAANEMKVQPMANKLPGVAVYPHVTNATTSPHDDPAVTTALRALMALDEAQLAALAQKLATVDTAFSDRLADMLLINVGLDLPTVMPSEQFLRAVLANVEREDYRYQVAMTQ